MDILNLRSELRNNRCFLSMDNDFYIFDVSSNALANYPFKIDMNVCCICLRVESKGKINLTP